MNTQLGAILTAMVTPFDQRDELDLREAQRLARWLVERGNDGLVVAGSTGEGQTLDARERVALWSAVKEAVGSDAVVVANAGTNSTRESVAAVEDAASSGADAILAVVPYYNKPTQSGMLAHFGAIAQATPLPVVVYNIPGRTAANMLPETLFELSRRHSNLVGVKESSGDLKQIGIILRERPKGLSSGPATIISSSRVWPSVPTASWASPPTSVRSSTRACSRRIDADASRRPRKFTRRFCRSSTPCLPRRVRSR